MRPRIHLTGASGSGTTTLGLALAESLGLRHFDVDDYYWVPTDPPYLRKRKYAERVALMEAELDDSAGWVVSGSMMNWGDSIADRATLIVFLEAPTDVRIARLRRRELQELGPRILDGGDMATAHRNFIAWASGYEDGTFGGRSRAKHEAWMASRSEKILRLNGTKAVFQLASMVEKDPRILEQNT